jgi:hypothetical protein
VIFGPDPVAVIVAKGALIEVGRADLATKVTTNKHDMPMLVAYHGVDREVIARAFVLGHQAAGHDARYSTWNLDNVPSVHCETCIERMERAA